MKSLEDWQKKMVLAMRKFKDIDKSFECRSVLGFNQYAHLVEECSTQYQLGNKKKVIKDTLKRLEKEAGSLTYYGIAQYLLHKNGGHLTTDMVIQHIRDIIVELIKKEGDVMASLQKTGDSYVSKNVVQGLIELMASLTVEEVIHEISKKDKEQEDNEDGEVE